MTEIEKKGVEMRKEFDVSKWNRKEHFEYYSKIATPHYCVAFNVDITELLEFTRRENISFYYSLIYLCTKAINSIDEFLLEVDGEKVYKIGPPYTLFYGFEKRGNRISYGVA